MRAKTKRRAVERIAAIRAVALRMPWERRPLAADEMLRRLAASAPRTYATRGGLQGLFADVLNAIELVEVSVSERVDSGQIDVHVKALSGCPSSVLAMAAKALRCEVVEALPVSVLLTVAVF